MWSNSNMGDWETTGNIDDKLDGVDNINTDGEFDWMVGDTETNNELDQMVATELDRACMAGACW